MAEWVFQRDAIQSFRFVRCTFDPDLGEAKLTYAFDQSPELVERITIPGAPFTLDRARSEAAHQALHLLHLLAGVSYYKAALPARIEIDGDPIDAETAEFLHQVYSNGLGEFAHRNGLDLRGRIRFPHGVVGGDPAPSLGLREHALVAIGGGKDSLVSIEALRAAGVEQSVVWAGSSQLIAACATRTGLPTVNINRQLAPELFAYNRNGAWNGHIPVTAINSAILVFAAVLCDANQVVFSNERSASYGSMIPGVGEINHQWSKGWAFEKNFAAQVRRTVAADLRYYSLLRTLSELAVARQFAVSDRYDSFFSSCNRNFHLLGDRPGNRWCGVCPKCHFVFLALGVFVPKPRLVHIFGRNLLDDPAQIPGYDALLEYRDHKPFECVGEASESRAAMAALVRQPEWREDAVVARFAEEILPQLDREELQIEPLLQPSDEHAVPAALWQRLRDRFAS